MVKKFLAVVYILALLHSVGLAQFFSVSDTTITFKNQEGKVLTKYEVQEYMRGVFSFRQQIEGAKKVVTIIPTFNDEKTMQQARLDTFKNNLLNKPVKSFHLKDLNNKIWDSEQLRGKTIVINFWFTACKPCILEMPHLNQLVEDNKEKHVVFIAPAPENETQIKRFLKKYNFAYHIIPSSLEYITNMNVENFPTHILIDKEGIVRQVFIGYADDIKEKLQEEINKLIK